MDDFDRKIRTRKSTGPIAGPKTDPSEVAAAIASLHGEGWGKVRGGIWVMNRDLTIARPAAVKTERVGKVFLPPAIERFEASRLDLTTGSIAAFSRRTALAVIYEESLDREKVDKILELAAKLDNDPAGLSLPRILATTQRSVAGLLANLLLNGVARSGKSVDSIMTGFELGGTGDVEIAMANALRIACLEAIRLRLGKTADRSGETPAEAPHSKPAAGPKSPQASAPPPPPASGSAVFKRRKPPST